MPDWSAPSRRPLPLILIRGFGGLGIEDEKRIAYQGFNDGTVYPNKRGDNYIYEGMILKFMKSAWQYQDATNVVGYFPAPVVDATTRPADLSDLPDSFFFQPADSEESVRPSTRSSSTRPWRSPSATRRRPATRTGRSGYSGTTI